MTKTIRQSLLVGLVLQRTLGEPRRLVQSFTGAEQQQRYQCLQRVDPDGSLSLRRIAEKLNERSVPTISGRGTWSANSVRRLKVVD